MVKKFEKKITKVVKTPKEIMNSANSCINVIMEPIRKKNLKTKAAKLDGVDEVVKIVMSRLLKTKSVRKDSLTQINRSQAKQVIREAFKPIMDNAENILKSVEGNRKSLEFSYLKWLDDYRRKQLKKEKSKNVKHVSVSSKIGEGGSLG